MPGLNRAETFARLCRAGYDGAGIIAQKGRDFEGTDTKVKRGFLLAQNVLRLYTT